MTRKTPAVSRNAHIEAQAAPGAARALPSKPKRDRARVREEFKTSMLAIRVKDELKQKASATLAEIGISLPEAVRVFLGRVVSERAFPFPLEVPNAETAEALKESRNSHRRRYTAVAAMLDDLEKDGRR